jgi:hypothetical protein
MSAMRRQVNRTWEDVANRRLDVDLILLLGDLTFTPGFDSSNTFERTRNN